MKRIDNLMMTYKAAIKAAADSDAKKKEAQKAFLDANRENGRITNESVSGRKDVEALCELKKKLSEVTKETERKFIHWKLDFDGPEEKGWVADSEDRDLEEALSLFVDKLKVVDDEIEKRIKKLCEDEFQKTYNRVVFPKEEELRQASEISETAWELVRATKNNVLQSPDFPLRDGAMDRVFQKITQIRTWDQKRYSPEFDVRENGDITVPLMIFDTVDLFTESPIGINDLWDYDEYQDVMRSVQDDLTEGVQEVLPEGFLARVELHDADDWDIHHGEMDKNGDYRGDLAINVTIPAILTITKEKEPSLLTKEEK